VKNGISAWIINWKKNNWVTSTGTPVKNKELWIAIDEVRNKLKLVNWKWVKAHNGDLKNEEVDKLAYEAAGGTAAKFYGIIRGHIPGIYTTWGEAKTQIDEYPGAVYKSFKTRPEAEKYMNTPVKECIYLNVPFSDKDHVKSFGAKWDPVKKKWWVQEMKPELENYIC
jgi:ribonuclease HI|tara:strand:- start:188 stop:691 length:504 start_codon:yes stop_codon:yes gene_type:complete